MGKEIVGRARVKIKRNMQLQTTRTSQHKLIDLSEAKHLAPSPHNEQHSQRETKNQTKNQVSTASRRTPTTTSDPRRPFQNTSTPTPCIACMTPRSTKVHLPTTETRLRQCPFKYLQVYPEIGHVFIEPAIWVEKMCKG